jgi:F-type H+-transporting ATPase subunit a
MHEELWFTKILNDLLGGAAASLLHALGIHPHSETRPIPNYVAMEILVALVVVAVFLYLRTRLSMDRPGVLQHFFELFYDFVGGVARDQCGHHGQKFTPMVMTLGVFILASNLIGLVPSLESPTMFIYVTLGCAMLAWLYYHYQGFRIMGVGGYLKHFGGPVWWLSPLMFPIEVVSHCGRPLSLSVRLYANMYAGEQVFLVFLGLVPIGIPMIFIGLHTFVAFLQTYIFMLLTLIYLGGASHEEHHGEDGAAHAH